MLQQRTIGKSQVWLTPKYIIDALGPFDLDPCAAPMPRPWSTARLHIVEAENGLLQKWNGRVWLNPPYDRRVIGQWMGRLCDHGIGTALICARTDTGDFFKYVWGEAEAALFLRGRLTFLRPDGTPGESNIGVPSVLVAYGSEDADRLMTSGLDGHYVPLSPMAGLFVFMRKVPDDVLPHWRDVVIEEFVRAGGRLTLGQLYGAFERHPKTRANPNWRAKLRQVAQAVGKRVAPSTYQLNLTGGTE